MPTAPLTPSKVIWADVCATLVVPAPLKFKSTDPSDCLRASILVDAIAVFVLTPNSNAAVSLVPPSVLVILTVGSLLFTMWSFSLGAFVPIPTLPSAFIRTASEFPG